jgi:hypothetical protein
MELFKTHIKDHEIIYVVDDVKKDYRKLGLSKGSKLVALVDPILFGKDTNESKI